LKPKANGYCARHNPESTTTDIDTITNTLDNFVIVENNPKKKERKSKAAASSSSTSKKNINANTLNPKLTNQLITTHFPRLAHRHTLGYYIEIEGKKFIINSAREIIWGLDENDNNVLLTYSDIILCKNNGLTKINLENLDKSSVQSSSSSDKEYKIELCDPSLIAADEEDDNISDPDD
jgi:hypothetical protein